MVMTSWPAGSNGCAGLPGLHLPVMRREQLPRFASGAASLRIPGPVAWLSRLCVGPLICFTIRAILVQYACAVCLRVGGRTRDGSEESNVYGRL